MTAPVIKLQDVKKDYPMEGETVRALKDINIEINRVGTKCPNDLVATQTAICLGENVSSVVYKECRKLWCAGHISAPV